MLIACLNGGVARDRHPKVPLTPTELAEDARRCREAGAAAVHIHPRDGHGAESLAAADVAAAVDAIREACPGLPISVTTGAWIIEAPDERRRAIETWTVLPDYASVNVHEDGAEDVAKALHNSGVGVEAGVWTPHAAVAYAGWSTPCARVLVECMAPDPPRALADGARMLALLPHAPTPVLLHAEGPAVWCVLHQAIARDVDARIGLEDTLVLPDGSTAIDNVSLVVEAVRLGAVRPETAAQRHV